METTPFQPTNPAVAPAEMTAVPAQAAAAEAAAQGGFRGAVDRVRDALVSAYESVVTGVGMVQTGLRPEHSSAAPQAGADGSATPKASLGEKFDKVFNLGLRLTGAAGLGVAAVAAESDSSHSPNMLLAADATSLPADPVNTVAPMPGHSYSTGEHHDFAFLGTAAIPAIGLTALLAAMGKWHAMGRRRDAAVHWTHPRPDGSPSPAAIALQHSKTRANNQLDHMQAGGRLGIDLSRRPGHVDPPGYVRHPFYPGHNPMERPTTPPPPAPISRWRYWSRNSRPIISHF